MNDGATALEFVKRKLRGDPRMRFEAADEKAFVSSLRGDLAKIIVLLGCIFVFSAIAGGLPTLWAETRRLDMPFKFDSKDPRTLSLASGLCCVLIACLSVVVGMLCCCGLLPSMNLEWYWTFSTTITLLLLTVSSKFYSARWRGRDPGEIWEPSFANFERSEFMGLYNIIAALVVSGQVVPVRTRIMWTFFFVGSLAPPVQTMILGSPISNNDARNGAQFILVLLGVFSFIAARRREFQLRVNWRAKHDAAERDIYLQGLQAMSWVSCEVLLRVGPDGVFKDTASEHESFFAQKVEGCRVDDFIADGSKEHFSELLRRAEETRTPQSMPAPLILSVAEVQAQVVVMCISGASTKYIVGITEVERKPRGGMVTISTLDPWEQHDTSCGESPPSENVFASFRRGPMSVATTSYSNFVFNDIERICSGEAGDATDSLRSNLEKVAKMGLSEHWLIGSGEIELFPSLTLGSGAFGSVVTGRVRGALVAVKLPKGDGVFANSAKLLGSFINELRLLRRIRNPNIVAFYGASLDPSSGDVAMVFEYVSGTRMGTFVTSAHESGHAREHQGAPMTVLQFDVGIALMYLHSLEPTVVHGDLKESNIMVYKCQQQYHQAKLLDFGLSRLLTVAPRPLGGTRPWMAPELFREAASYPLPRPATSADVFSFGMLVHFSMTCVPVCESFDGSDVSNRFSRLSWPEGVPMADGVRRMCADALATSPGDRPEMPRLVQELGRWLESSGAPYPLLGESRVQFFCPADSWDVGASRVRAAAARHVQQL